LLCHCTDNSCFSAEGVAGVEAEAELLAAMVMFFQKVGLTAEDVAIKVSSRQLLQAVLEQHMVPAESTSRVFVTVDKMDKLPKETVSHISIHTLSVLVSQSAVPTCALHCI
jgi:histidyl-tRNA synthetase